MTQSADLTDQSEQPRSADSRPEHRSDNGVDPVQRIVGRRPDCGIDHDDQLGSDLVEDPVDQGFLRIEPVQHRLFTHPDDTRYLVERHGNNTTYAEQIKRRIEDSLTRRSIYHVIIMTSLSTNW